MTDTAMIQAARNAANAGHELAQTIRAALEPADQAKWDHFELAGAEVAMTLRWMPDKAEVKLGFVLDDSAPQLVFELAFPRPVPSQSH